MYYNRINQHEKTMGKQTCVPYQFYLLSGDAGEYYMIKIRMKKPIPFRIDKDQLDKVDDLKIRLNKNRSEALRYIISEFFVKPTITRDLIEEIERLKIHNRELQYQIQEMSERLIKQNKEMMTVLLMLCSQNDNLIKEVMDKFPHLVRIRKKK